MATKPDLPFPLTPPLRLVSAIFGQNDCISFDLGRSHAHPGTWPSSEDGPEAPYGEFGRSNIAIVSRVTELNQFIRANIHVSLLAPQGDHGKHF